MSGLMELFVEKVERGDDDAAKFYRLVAERIRTRALTEDEAEVIAGWFDRIAAGDAPASVLPHRRQGRRKGRLTAASSVHQKARQPMADGRIPDDHDVAHLVHQQVRKGMKRVDAERGVAMALGMKPGTVKNIYTRLKAEVEELQKGWV